MKLVRILSLAGLFALVTVAVCGADTLPPLPSLSSSPMNVVNTSDKNYSVTCYLGNPLENNTIGSITVTVAESAGPNCNSLFYSCRGSCFGCFADFDYSEDICVDSTGRKYLR